MPHPLMRIHPICDTLMGAYPGDDMRALCFCLSFIASVAAAQAETPLTADQFDTFTRGRTLEYSFDGQPYGLERYAPDRRVTWGTFGGMCGEGRWFPQGDRICFEYEDLPGPLCWSFYAEGANLRAVLHDIGGDQKGYRAEEWSKDMTCEDPDPNV